MEMNGRLLDEFTESLEGAGFRVSEGFWLGDTVTFGLDRNGKIDGMYEAGADVQDMGPFIELMPDGLKQLLGCGAWTAAWGAVTFTFVDSGKSCITGYGLSLRKN